MAMHALTGHLTRRAALLLFIATLSTTLSACGFHLRGAAELPFKTVYLGFPPNSAFGAELARNLRAGTRTQVVDKREEADAALEVSGEVREREVLSLNAQGRAREYQLRSRVTLRVVDRNGRELLSPVTLSAQRDVAFNDAQVLAKESEETLLYRDMQSDLVQQILRRLAAVQVHAASR